MQKVLYSIVQNTGNDMKVLKTYCKETKAVRYMNKMAKKLDTPIECYKSLLDLSDPIYTSDRH